MKNILEIIDKALDFLQGLWFRGITNPNMRGIVLSEIKEFLLSKGISESDLVLDGTMKNIKTDKFKGWYIGESVGPNQRRVTFGDWKTKDKRTLTEGLDMSDPKVRAEIELANSAYLAEKLALQEEKKLSVVADLNKILAQKWGRPSKYLKNKGITQTHGAILSRSLTIGTDLIIPMHDEQGVVWNYQRIQDDGFKSFVPGARVDGLWFMLQPSASGHPDSIYICEGFATACSVAMALNDNYSHWAVVCAFSATNLKATALALRGSHPDSKIILVADNDAHVPGNPGVRLANEAAAMVQGFIVIPTFDQETTPKDTP
jgi:putative DNA primase/helicase